MPITQEGPFLCPDKGIFPDNKEQAITSSEESSSILKRSPQRPSEGFPLSTKGITRCLVNRSRKGYPDTLFGTTLSNYSLELLHHYLADSSPSLRAKLLKHKNL